LLICLSCKLVPQYHGANLFDLVGFGLRAYWLKIKYFFNACLRKNVVAASYPFIKAEVPE